ncbi:YceH family protein [Noviherbaspirillum pedocola]|uniref:YceH family protein n=1 Tax=Noviherbaspirillum pedocola TaxID=2801341 RepID=A0A934SPN8_9BURK|nr:YceH family protein [Noviherbaspirillum pedocola]MBK4734310.1 YceH family protein [Noviherbaspirillum pedocola]
MSDDLPLSAAEIRVLGVLAEKEALTPDNYPLSLNSLTAGCNQLSSREPVMQLSEDEVMDTLGALMAKKLAAEVSQAGARVKKYEHRMRPRWSLEQDKLAALVVLMLRGPQTAGEVRTRVGRIHEYASVAELENALQFLIDKYPPLVARLARAPGAREVRYAHLLAGEIDEAALLAQGESATGSSKGDRVARLEEEVAALRAEMERMSQEFAEIRKLLE